MVFGRTVVMPVAFRGASVAMLSMKDLETLFNNHKIKAAFLA
jgi:hypothetical protein